jgi:hypothetical protein
MNGTGKSVDMTMDQEEAAERTVMATLWKVLRQIRADERHGLAARLLKRATDPEKFMAELDRLLSGTWRDNAILGVSAVAGVVAGSLLGRATSGVKSIGPVPPIALLGLLGVGGGLFLKETLTFRNTLNLGGLMFSAGAVLQKLLVP